MALEDRLLDYTVDHGETGLRLDAFLAGRDPKTSRSRFKALIKEGHVRVGGRKLDEPNYRVKPGERIETALPEPAEAEPAAEDIPLNTVYEDADLIVVDKAAGMVVHPAPGAWSGTLVNALLFHCAGSLSGIGGVKRPGIVHRLDKETSGLLVVAKNDAAHQALAEQFADHGREGPLEREYAALVWNVPQLPAGSVDAPLDRDPKNREKRAVRPAGRAAITHWKVEERLAGGRVSLLACRLETGRTHQIRVHMAHIGHPLLGDRLYGSAFRTKAALLAPEAAEALEGLGRQALHARLLAFAHPASGATMRFESPLPKEMETLLQALRKVG
ncbi:RluA family pseudouridine synthase [Afifella sp. IM 167]|uniref:RluA family pseudouridine synthase n=1 Tax=Afifella sp. IM 167 TaxID=2033586 RepID=UPI001CD0366B|nr:RluA family pseudouridine synthase [Afifella sp. IM 167]